MMAHGGSNLSPYVSRTAAQTQTMNEFNQYPMPTLSKDLDLLNETLNNSIDQKVTSTEKRGYNDDEASKSFIIKYNIHVVEEVNKFTSQCQSPSKSEVLSAQII